MQEETKNTLMKLFEKHSQINAVSDTRYLTEQDFRYLIHDKSFPVELPVKPEIAVDRLIKEFTRRFTEYEYQQGVKKSWVTGEAGRNPEIITNWLREELR